MAELPGTIPAIKQRPKVAKRPTILAPPAQKANAKAAQKSAAAAGPAGRKADVAQKPEEAKKPVVAEKPAKERAKSGMRPVLNFKSAKPAGEPVCAVAAPAVPIALEPTRAAALALPEASEPEASGSEASESEASGGPVGSGNSQVAAVSTALAVSTIPPVRERPKVSRKSTIKATLPTLKGTGKARPAKKPVAAATVIAEDKNKTLAGSWISWAPLAVGIVLGFLSPQLHALAAQWDPWGLRIVFPVVQVLGLRELGIGDELNRTLPQLMLYLQFPLEGLLVAMNMRRGMRFAMAIGPIPALHFVCGLVLWIVALGSLKPI